ncbi:MAG: hypothetical protein C4288_18720 [Leptolyngbya sp. ERB_1_1]
MATLDRFNYQGIEYYVDLSDPSSFYYIPGIPTSQHTPQGQPAASLMVLDQLAMLQLSSEWDVSSDQLEELRTAIAKQFHLGTVSLQPAPLTVESVILSLKTNKGDFEVLKSAESSGYPPFTTVFSVQLDNEQKAQAIAAFNGRKDQLIITYKVSLKTEIVAEVMIKGDVTEDLKKLPKTPTLEDCSRQIDSAIVQHRLKLEQSSKAPEDLLEKAIQLAKRRAAQLLLSMAEDAPIPYDRTHFQASASLTNDDLVKIERSTDISTWFATRSGMNYVQILTV